MHKIISITALLLFLTGTAEAGTGKEIHKTCTLCHAGENYTAIKTIINETCLKCHSASAGKDHPIGVVSPTVPPDLPLSEGNKMTCITCHEPHGKNTVGRLLRLDFNKLCISCHKNI